MSENIKTNEAEKIQETTQKVDVAKEVSAPLEVESQTTQVYSRVIDGVLQSVEATSPEEAEKKF